MKLSWNWKLTGGLVIALPVCVIILLYLFYKMSPLISQLKIDVVLAEYGILEEVVSAEGVALRQESVYPVTADHGLRWVITEGQKVARQQKLAEILISDQDHALLLQNQLIDMRLKNLQSGGDLSAYSQEAEREIDQQMNFLMSDIRLNLKNGQYELAFQNQQMLEELADQHQLIAVHRQLPEMTLEELEVEKEKIEQRLKHTSHEIRAESPGIFAIGDDGWGEKLRLSSDDEEASTLADSFLHLIKEPGLEDTGYYRIIHDQRWQLLLAVNEELAKQYESGIRLLIRDPITRKEVRGTLREVLTSASQLEVILVIDMQDGIGTWYQSRVLPLELIHQRHEGLKLPISAIMSDHSGKSVYRIDVNGYAVKTPVKELGRDDRTVVVGEGAVTVTASDSEGHEVRMTTIRQYDEIIANPTSVVEGQKVR
ncbi:HlyD family efflux transporter periplasmic adaptor subunit [Anoxynatronum sibiricum]|uniref:HlyD family efflux transporter periplasmic adaptor subunit n=1 Tax=Anoxynatronum sibiricum TaxID=210623 RepID=A0ABU9VQR2_9CLOT